MYKHILIATDGSKLATRGLMHGLALAKASGAPVTIVFVTEMWSVFEMIHEYHEGGANPIVKYEELGSAAAKRVLDDATKLAAGEGVKCDVVHVADRRPAEAIVETAAQRHCDLIVMASHGRRGVERLMLGSQAYEVLTHSKIPTLIVK